MLIEWSLVLYSLFMGLSIGPFALLALTDACEQRAVLCKWASLVALGSIALAGISAFTHLLQPLKAVYMFANFSSPMTQETVVVLLTGLVAALLVAQLYFNFLPGLRRPTAALGLLLAVVSVVMIAMIYLLPARPAWNTWLLPLTLLLSSLINGLLLAWAMVVLVPRQTGETGRDELAGNLRRWALPFLVIYALIAVVYMVYAANLAGGIMRLITGDLAAWFWIGLIIAGLAAPAVLLWLGRQSPKAGALTAFLLVVVGGVVVRAMLFPLGVRIPIESLW